MCREQEALIELLLDKAETAYWANAPVRWDRSRNVTSKCIAGRGTGKRNGKTEKVQKKDGKEWCRMYRDQYKGGPINTYRESKANIQSAGNWVGFLKQVKLQQLAPKWESLNGQLVFCVSCFLMLETNLEPGAAECSSLLLMTVLFLPTSLQLFVPYHLSTVSGSFSQSNKI